jgi:hypothetical protein
MKKLKELGVKTRAGAWARYKKLTMKPDQIKGRAMLRKAVDDAVRGLNLMWQSSYATEKEIINDEMQSKYAYAAYYIFKYLCETKEFDSIAQLHGYRVHMLFNREDGTWVATNNLMGNAGWLIGEFMRDIGSYLAQAFREKEKE